MLANLLSSLAIGAGLAAGLPIPSNPAVKTGVTLDAAAVAQAMQRDNTATRALSGVPIKAPNGQCLFVDKTSGDFRENLIPIQTAPCDGSAAQQWDVITKGKHNDQPGFALIVSSFTQGCMNFDPRRAAGNQVILFSCGGRADGEGQVTDSQLFPFTSATKPLALAPKNGQNKVCLDIASNGLLDQTACNAASPSANELFTFGGAGAAAPAPPSPPPPPAKTPTTTNKAAFSTAAASAATKTSNPAVKTGVTLDAAAVAQAMQRDDTATRALSGVPIKASNGQCLFVDKTSGDFRENLIPIQTAPCDGSAAQQWDVITKGKHNDQPGFALIVSSFTQGCMNFDPRRAAGDQVLLFSCGGRADGEGQVTDSQLFPFTSAAKPLALAPENGQNKVCFVIASNGLLDQTACNAAAPSANELFTFGGAGAAAPPPASPPPAAASTKAAATTTKAVVITTKAATTAATTPVTKTTNPAVKTGVTLDLAAVAEAMQRDDTATRALSSVSIKASNGQCLFVDKTSGDFRENLIPIQTAPCDGSAAQQWDVITKGKHNDQPGFALIVSSFTQGCMNFDPRRAAGNQVILFSCGGRADGEGQVTNSQLFKFTSAANPIALVPQNGNNQVCLKIASNGLLDQTACNANAPSADELFKLG